MPRYPISTLSTSHEHLNVLQITDLHLSSYGDITADADAELYSCQLGFEAVLKQALNENRRCDLILVTGDLISKFDTAIYDYIFRALTATNIPFACIAGNHDVTDEVGEDLPFFQRELIAQPADPRLLSCHAIQTDCWQLLLLNSAVPGKVAGEITPSSIEWLCQQLSTCDKPALIALHHHVMPMQSDWIDAHIADNADMFWERVAPFEHLRAVVAGHTHQEQVRHKNGVTVYNTPSTCYQFKPFEHEFAFDEEALPGYRWLQLANNGAITSWVTRLDIQ